MILSIEKPMATVALPKVSSGAGRPAPRLVICQPSALYAEAIEALVKKQTRWEVVCTTTEINTAIGAAAHGRANALLFESVLGTARGVAALIRRLRTACPGVALILFTEHTGARFSTSALRAGIGACIHKQDSLPDFYAGLRAVEQGCRYRSALIANWRNNGVSRGPGYGVAGPAMAVAP